ncbi:MAG: bifunctional diaminohydroxyphosphoribosylaminopyrimidine deaminase/5-amino-6-(5-phosphoribosylamino)uracil reductase RibD, partial [Acidobacteriia bacterium]|nr:bifunctional diaminohydroxyphosphoribosylaminopyrimidine deaminase/5-amino-6-(5-phosphoribosylamino)uracil reductase RibD [Terriglobia bacterium]
VLAAAGAVMGGAGGDDASAAATMGYGLDVALAAAAARGATLYVSLEPCSIHRRTPPCVDAILAAGIARVVAASRDRNPAVDGSGFALLRQSGVEVEEAAGELAASAQRLNEAFFHYARTGRPLVTLKTALTLDGKIAAPDDNTGWITSDKARAHVQQVRHRHDAIMTGIGTVHADDCLLTDRTGLPRRRALLRVIADSLLRIPLNSRLVESVSGDLVIATTSAAGREKRKPLLERDVMVQDFDSPSGRVDLHALLDWLGERDVTSLMIEGGAKLNWAVLEAGIVNKVLLYYAPKILG